MSSSGDYITNINRALRNIKSDILADFVYSDHCSLIITTNKVAAHLDLNVIENYVKNINIIKTKDIMTLCLSQSKLYLKIIGIPYYKESTKFLINSSNMEKTIQSTHILNNIQLVSKLRVIKALPKSDMAVIWFDIWDIKSSVRAKCLINRCFNVGNHIATIRGANMNSDVFQYKNCWKWDHTTFTYQAQGSRCIKCNRLHKVEHYQHFAWCCKAKFKTNSPYIETKQGKPYPYSFKCLNCKSDYQTNSNTCSF